MQVTVPREIHDFENFTNREFNTTFMQDVIESGANYV